MEGPYSSGDIPRRGTLLTIFLSQEAQESTITLHDDSPLAIDMLIEYMYLGNLHLYDLPPANGSTICIQIFAAADKYDLPNLATLAANYFISKIQFEWNEPGFLDAIRNLYNDCPETALARQMRESVIAICVKHEAVLLKELFRSEFNEVIKDVPLFAIEFRRASIEKLRSDMHADREQDKRGWKKWLDGSIREERSRLWEVRWEHAKKLSRETRVMVRERERKFEEIDREHEIDSETLERERKLSLDGLEVKHKMNLAGLEMDHRKRLEELEMEHKKRLKGLDREHMGSLEMLRDETPATSGKGV